MKTYGYYPGCSVRSSSKSYEKSLLLVMKGVGLKLKEIDDWNCCGATAYFGTDKKMATAIAGRNLCLAEQQKLEDMVIPCTGCYLTLRKSQDHLKENKSDIVSSALEGAGLKGGDNVALRHPVDVLFNDVGVEKIKSFVKKPLKNWKIASYYGCQLVRPYGDVDDPYNPTILDKIMTTCGAEAVEYPYKTRCCGGALTGTVEDVGLRLVYILLAEMIKRGANCVVTMCPLCHFNLDVYQSKVEEKFGEEFKKSFGRKYEPLPILHFTQAMGIAFGFRESELGLSELMVEPKALLKAV
ncbi:MAG: disulfide reductase [Thermoanaerobaculaceae bacterium]|nr:disulfide reductase [Thermoanaerobaculaceae bacterium]